MLRRVLFVLLVVACIAVSARQASAQRFRGTADNPVGPTVSPYLNLVQPDQFGVTNYQSLVRPLVQQGNAINRQGADINRIQQQMYSQRGGARGTTPSATGHVTFFMNYSHYYPVTSDR